MCGLLPSITLLMVYLLRTVAVDEYCVLTDYVNVTPGDNDILTFAEEAHHSAFSVNYNRNKLSVCNIDFNIINVAKPCAVGFTDDFFVS